ncbi:MAG: hypothetical protein JWO56_2005, partial [Acidobacteria bacterium]|nr:hypothetical protein [Acidobacteriota bacterium]
LTDRTVRAFVANAQNGTATKGKLGDGGGLYLTVTERLTPVWRMKYRTGMPAREKTLSFGVYPEVGLAMARAGRDAAREQLRLGKDPGQTRKLARLAEVAAGDATFASVAEMWLKKNKDGWSDVHYQKSRRALVRDVLPTLGPLPMANVTAPVIATAVLPIANRGARDTAGRVLQHIGGVCRFAEGLGLLERDPTPAVRELLPRKGKTGRRHALLEVGALRDVLRRADLAPISPAVRMAHRLAAFTAARIGNVVDAAWEEFALDGDVAKWVIPRAKMKAKDRFDDHKILLGPTITAELRAWRSLIGTTGYLFPSPAGGRFISRESIEKAYRVTLGLAGKHTVHGWRSAFSTLARDAGFTRDVVELTLDHIHDTEVVRAYDRGERLVERAHLMKWWDCTLAGKSLPERPLDTAAE